MITGLDAGGAELQLAMILRRTRHEADVVTLYNPGPVAEKIRAQGTSVRDLGMKTNTELGALPRLRCPVTAARSTSHQQCPDRPGGRARGPVRFRDHEGGRPADAAGGRMTPTPATDKTNRMRNRVT